MSRFLFWFLLALVTLPLAVVFASLAKPDLSIWQHLLNTVLVEYVLNSVLLAIGVGVGTAVLGSSLAWALTQYRFPFSRLLAWLAVLPLAMPAYIIAYTYTGMLDFSGPVQQALRDLFGWGYGDYWFPNIRSLGGAICMMTLVLFPYVYLLARNAFVAQPENFVHAAQSFGVSKRRYFIRVAWPLAWPAVVAGMALAIMEALADYGTVAYFGVSTFTTGIFRTWFGMGSRETALQLAALLTLFVFFFLFIEYRSRQNIRTDSHGKPQSAQQVSGAKAWGLTIACTFPILLGFIIPTLQLLSWSVTYIHQWQWLEYWPLIKQSLLLAGTAAFVTVCAALFISYVKRWNPSTTPQWSIHLASLGYALPGVVIAVGVLIPLGFIDRSVNEILSNGFNYQPGLVLSGTIFVLIFAYLIRFLAVALQHTQTGLGRITPNMDDASRSLGLSSAQAMRRVHIPLIKTSLITAMLLVFVDVLKELPATLVLRPFNVNTLAVKAYELAMDERLQQAALPSLTIVLCGMLPVIYVVRQLQKYEEKHATS